MTDRAESPTLAADQIERRSLRLPRNRVERRAILLWTLSSVIWSTVILGGMGLVHTFWEPSRPFLEPLLVIGGVISVINALAMPGWRYLVHRWEITDQAVYALNGWVVREWRITPVSRIQSIDTVRGPLHQLFGLATLRVSTASAQGDVRIRGLDVVVAAEAAQRLTEITEATRGDAT